MVANAHAVHQIHGRCLVTTKPVKTTLNGTVTQPGGVGYQKNNKLGEKSWSAKLWKQIIRSVTTEHNNSVSGDGNACIAWGTSTMRLSEQFKYISYSMTESYFASRKLLIWVTMLRWRKVYRSMNQFLASLSLSHWVFSLCHSRSLTEQQHSKRQKSWQCLIRMLIRKLAVYSNILHNWPFESRLSHLSCSRLRGRELEVRGIRHY